MLVTEELEDLHNLVEIAKLENEKATLEASTGAMRIMASHVGKGPEAQGNPLQEGWGDKVDPAEYLKDGRGASHFGELANSTIARPEDHRDGDNAPFWRSEAEHRMISGAARILATTSEVGMAALENLTNYTIGGGFGYQFMPKRGYEKDPEAVRWARLAQAVSDQFDEANGFEEEGERELFVRSRRDGEFFGALTHRGGLSVELRQVDSTFVTEPDNKRGLEDYLDIGYALDWKYGIAAEPGNSTKVYGYFVEWNGSNNDWDYYPASEMVHCKLNVDREVKRGLSDYFPVQGNLSRGDKLLGNTLEGAAIQAAIAFIRQHGKGVTKQTIQDMVDDRIDSTISTTSANGSLKDRNIAKYRPGTIHDVTNGMEYKAGPMGSPNGPRFIEVVQAALRMVGIRWSMPEYMISGDASNGTFSSTLVAESPFTKSTEAKQSIYKRKYRETKWKAVGLVAKKTGRFGTQNLQMIKRKVELSVDAPEVAVRDRLQDHQIRKGQHEAGFLSLDTWATEEKRDLKDEKLKGAKPQPKTGPVQGTVQESVASFWSRYP